MPNLRIVFDNAADRGTTGVSSSVGAFVPGNLKNDLKSLVWRSAGSGANLNTRPSAFDDAAWGKTNCTVVPNSEVAPDGTLTADLLSFTAANGTASMAIATAPGYMVGTRHTFSVWLWTQSGTATVDLAVGDFNYQNLYSGGMTVTTTPTKYTFTTIVNAWNPAGAYITCQIRGWAISNVYAWSAELYKVPQASISTTWSVAELISAVALPFSNLTPTATMRVRLSNELAKTNLNVNNSQSIGAGTNMTVVQQAEYAPDGTLSAGLHIPTASAVVHELGQAAANYTAGQTYTVSFFTRLHAGSPWVGWNFVASSNIGSGGAGSVRVDNQAVTGAGSISSTSIAGWYRVSFTFTSTATMLSNVFIRPINAAGQSNVAGDGIKGLHLWGVQVEYGSLSSYYPTVSAPATRPAGYIDSWQSYTYDSTTLACPATQVVPNGFTALQAQSAYAYGGGAYAKTWFSPAMYTGCRVDITDINNQSGYIESSRLIIGNYWSPAKNASYGFSNSIQDMSKNVRTQSGDLMSDSSPTNRKIAFNIEELDATDRKTLYSILRRSGMRSSMFISLTPENVDAELERDNMIYGKLSAVSAMSIPFFGAYSFPIEMEEI